MHNNLISEINKNLILETDKQLVMHNNLISEVNKNLIFVQHNSLLKNLI